jgi:hypothetical protein
MRIDERAAPPLEAVRDGSEDGSGRIPVQGKRSRIRLHLEADRIDERGLVREVSEPGPDESGDGRRLAGVGQRGQQHGDPASGRGGRVDRDVPMHAGDRGRVGLPQQPLEEQGRQARSQHADAVPM